VSQGKTATVVLSIAIVSVMAVVVFARSPEESDSKVLAQVKANQARVPNYNYPTVDIRGRKFSAFDYLIVMPDCNSCSDFRLKSRSFMDENPNMRFLILTPDLNDSDDLLKKDNYYVVKLDPKSKLAQIPAGGYKR
jgi:hypothetical protein